MKKQKKYYLYTTETEYEILRCIYFIGRGYITAVLLSRIQGFSVQYARRCLRLLQKDEVLKRFVLYKTPVYRLSRFGVNWIEKKEHSRQLRRFRDRNESEDLIVDKLRMAGFIARLQEEKKEYRFLDQTARKMILKTYGISHFDRFRVKGMREVFFNDVQILLKEETGKERYIIAVFPRNLILAKTYMNKYIMCQYGSIFRFFEEQKIPLMFKVVCSNVNQHDHFLMIFNHYTSLYGTVTFICEYLPPPHAFLV